MSFSLKYYVFNLKNILFRKYAVDKYDEIKKNNFQTQTELDEIVLNKLKKLFSYCKKNNTYYRKKFEDIKVEDIKSIEDWNNLPILTKNDIRENFEDLISSNVSMKYMRKVTTGGSTGVPLALYHDARFPLEVLGWRTLKWWGIHPADNIAFIYRKVKTGWRAILNSIVWFPTKRDFLDASLMSEDSMADFYSKIKKSRPRTLQGYVGAVFEFAKYCQRLELDIDFIDCVWVTSAPLIESQRQIMESVFNAPVYDQYGCSEIYWLAAECSKKKGLHIHSDVRYIEILNENLMTVDKSVYGSLTITDLENYAFPLIRYQNGDRGRVLKEKCSCGLPFPLLDKVKGRVTDAILLPSGKIVAGDYLTTIFDDFPEAVEEFQIIQSKDYSIQLSCVIGKSEKANEICLLKIKEFQELISHEVTITLKIVDKISHIQGKTRFVISEVK